MPHVPAVTQPYGVGHGIQEPFSPANPATGANFTYQLDGYGVRRLLSLVFTVTAANAGSSRAVTVEYRGKDALPFSVNEATALLAIATAQRYAGSVWKGTDSWNTGTDALLVLDQVLLFPGDTLNIVITTLNASDTITNIRGVFERFLLDPHNIPALQSE